MYEGQGFYCKTCGRLGHTANTCSQVKIQSDSCIDTSRMEPKTNLEDEWHTVNFQKKNRVLKLKKKHQDLGIKVNIHALASGKSISFQTLISTSKLIKLYHHAPKTLSIKNSPANINNSNKFPTASSTHKESFKKIKNK